MDAFQDGRKLSPPATVLRGPADADHFRVKVGRYGDRWYHDPLPGCDIAPATDATWPSVSTCKKASGSDWSAVSLKRVAHALEERPARLDGMAWGERYDALKSINDRGLKAAGQRGTNVHLMFEARLYGQPCPVGDNDPGANYRPAVDAFFDQYQPELVAAECVVIARHLNSYGYGGTFDSILRIDGKLYGVDYKSRGEDSDHGAYPEEAAQLGAYFSADYMIVEGPTGPVRAAIPNLAGGLIVSVKPDGCRIYPIDLSYGNAHWECLHDWWVARRTERDAVGKPWAPRKIAAKTYGPGPCDICGGPRRLGPIQIYYCPIHELDRITVKGIGGWDPFADTRAAHDPDLGEADALVSAPTPAAHPISGTRVAGPAPPTIPSPSGPGTPAEQTARIAHRRHPDEGRTASTPDRFTPLNDRYNALDEAGSAWLSLLTEQSMQAQVSFHATVQTERRFHLVDALLTLAEHDQCDDDLLRGLLELVIGDPAQFPAVTPGALVGSLDVREAKTFADYCRRSVATSFAVGADGSLTPA